MEIDYNHHIMDSEMLSTDENQSSQHHCYQVMMAFEHEQSQTHFENQNQIEIEMLDNDEHSIPNQQSILIEPTSLLAPPLEAVPTDPSTQSTVIPDLTIVDSSQTSPTCLFPPTQSNSHQNPVQELPSQPSSEQETNDPAPEDLDPSSTEPILSSNIHPTLLSRSTHSRATSVSSHEALSVLPSASAPCIQASSSGAISASPSLPLTDSFSPRSPAHPGPDPLDGDSNEDSTLHHASTLLDNSAVQLELESNLHPEQQLGLQTSSEHNLLVDEVPYEEYELDNRPKVRTDLLEHVRVESESTSPDDSDLPVESQLGAAPGVRLVCDGCEYSLFQRIESSTNPDPTISDTASPDGETVLLSEPEGCALYYGPLEPFFHSLHNIFPNLHNNNKNEIVLNFPALEIKVPEDNIYSKEISLFDLDRLHIGARLPDRLLISLEKQPRLVHRFNVLATYVYELAENNPNMDGNLGEVFIEDDSDTPAEQPVANQKDDTGPTEILHEPRVCEDSRAQATPLDNDAVRPSMAKESQAVCAGIVVASPKGEKNDDLSDPDNSSFSFTLANVTSGTSAREQLDTIPDNFPVTDRSPFIHHAELIQLPEDTDKSADKTFHHSHETSCETCSEVQEIISPDQVVKSSQQVLAQPESIDPSLTSSKEIPWNEVESCSNSEHTITGLDQSSEDQVDDLIEGFEAASDTSPIPVGDPNNSERDAKSTSGVTLTDCYPNSNAPPAPISNEDENPQNLLSSIISPYRVGSKRCRTEIEDQAETFELSACTTGIGLPNSDVKKVKMLQLGLSQ